MAHSVCFLRLWTCQKKNSNSPVPSSPPRVFGFIKSNPFSGTPPPFSTPSPGVSLETKANLADLTYKVPATHCIQTTNLSFVPSDLERAICVAPCVLSVSPSAPNRGPGRSMNCWNTSIRLVKLCRPCSSITAGPGFSLRWKTGDRAEGHRLHRGWNIQRNTWSRCLRVRFSGGDNFEGTLLWGEKTFSVGD